MHRTPLIAVFPRTEARTNGEAALFAQLCLAQALQAVGAAAVVMAPTTDGATLERYVATFDGFVVPGGGDIDPALYNEERHPACGPVEALRDAFEHALLPRIVAADKPLLGICRGHQMLNVALGGTLWQDLPSQYAPPTPPLLTHRTDVPWDQIAHTVRVVPDTLLDHILQRAIDPESRLALPVNSLHHQAVRKVAAPLIASAFSPDGVIEALEIPGARFALSVQWHPEFLWEHDSASRAIFAALVEAAQNRLEPA